MFVVLICGETPVEKLECVLKVAGVCLFVCICFLFVCQICMFVALICDDTPGEKLEGMLKVAVVFIVFLCLHLFVCLLLLFRMIHLVKSLRACSKLQVE